MNVSLSSLTSNAALSSLAATQNSQSTPWTGADSDGAGGGKVHRHGGGHMRQAVSQALQSLGLSAPQDANSTSASGSTDTSSDSSSGTTTGTSSVQQDMQAFMHSLFEAVKSESASSSSSSSGSGDPQSSFASGLSALISQVGNGTAPADLQTAFSKLVADLQSSGSTSSATSSTSAGTATGSAQATLQAFLTNLQQDLGYATSNASGVGNLLTAQV